MLVFDKWTCNTNGRQAVFFFEPGRSRRQAMMIDQGFCFNAGEWNFPDAPLRGLYLRHRVYEQVTGIDSFEPWLGRVEQRMVPEVLGQIAEEIPPEWYNHELGELERLVARLDQRRLRVRELIVQHGEPNLRFAQRLLAEEGVFFFFDHPEAELASETLVLVDANNDCEAFERSPLRLAEAVQPHLKHEAVRSFLPDSRLIAGVIGLVIGCGAPYAFGRCAPIILTSIQGGMLMIIGFVGTTSQLAPSLASTFVEWTGELSFMGPLLLTMAVVTGYSVQANMQQGDISTGGTFGDLHQEEK